MRALLALTAAVALAVVSLSTGDYAIALADVVRALVGHGEHTHVFIVRDLRLPRAITGLLVGTCLGLAGALSTAVLRNPLATPDVLGVTTGASAAAVATLTLGLPLPLPVAALLGALTTGALLLLIARHQGLPGPRLVLAGIGLSVATTALVNYLLVRAQQSEAASAVVWLTGSLANRGWAHATPLLWSTLLLVPLAFACSCWLRTLSLGDDVAVALGTRVSTARTTLLVLSVVLAGTAVAAAGPVAFVALLAPRLAHLLRGSLALSAAMGALLVTAADLAARQTLSAELPVGAVTAVLGAPLLLLLLWRSIR